MCVSQSGQFSEDMIPTVGFNMRKITKGNVTIKVGISVPCFHVSAHTHTYSLCVCALICVVSLLSHVGYMSLCVLIFSL